MEYFIDYYNKSVFKTFTPHKRLFPKEKQQQQLN